MVATGQLGRSRQLRDELLFVDSDSYTLCDTALWGGK